MPRPAYPVDGEQISTQWARELTDFAGDKWRYVPNYSTPLAGVDASVAATTPIEITALPANDLTIVAVNVGLMIRDGVGVNGWQMNVFHYASGGNAGVAHASGVTNKGGYAGPFIVLVGGANNRWIKYGTNGVVNANMKNWMYVYGYWVRELPA